MLKAFACGLILAAALTVRVHPQSPAPPAPEAMTFDAASIKPNTSNSPGSGVTTMPGGRISIDNLSLRDIIQRAYGARDMEVIGGPDWLTADRWDIVAAPPPGHTDAEFQPMLRSLLAERANLRAHLEQRDRPIYNLVLARSDRRLGAHMHPTGCKDDDINCSKTSGNTSGIKSGTITGAAHTIASIGQVLSRYAERRVFDKTGLVGRYDFDIQWSEDLSIFTAVQEQLGLKLESANGPVDVLVIDRVDRPTAD